MNINRKIEQAIKLIQSAYETNPASIAVGFSGGKDSSVVAELVRLSGCPIPLHYKNSTIDRPGTIKFVEDCGATILQPKTPFYKLLEKKGVPNFARRFCCEKLKEYKVTDIVLTGVRREESKKRSQIEDFTRCRTQGYQEIMPILNWTLNEIACFIKKQNIKLHPYYKERDLKCRLGCMGCPLPYNRSITDFKENPKLLLAWIKHLRIFETNHGGFGNEKWTLEQELVNHFFFHNTDQFRAQAFGLFPLDCKKILETHFNVKL